MNPEQSMRPEKLPNQRPGPRTVVVPARQEMKLGARIGRSKLPAMLSRDDFVAVPVENEQRTLGVSDGFTLLSVQAFEKIHERGQSECNTLTRLGLRNAS